MAQERKAAQDLAGKQKKAKAQNAIMVDEGHVPTAEELRRRQMRAGRFGKGAVEHSVPVRAHAPVYAVRAFSIWLLSDTLRRHSIDYAAFMIFLLAFGHH